VKIGKMKENIAADKLAKNLLLNRTCDTCWYCSVNDPICTRNTQNWRSLPPKEINTCGDWADRPQTVHEVMEREA